MTFYLELKDFYFILGVLLGPYIQSIGTKVSGQEDFTTYYM